MKIILQTEIGECGLACLAMITEHYGYKATLRELRTRFPVSLKGANLKGIMKMAQQLNFVVRAVKIEVEDISSLNTPCILHWNLNHFVVLRRARANWAEIFDPATGVKKISFEKISESFTGIALELRPGPNFTKKMLQGRYGCQN
jgi:ATP-binding cassette, subfamily B, bacterial CvaB/MchF/RaxB